MNDQPPEDDKIPAEIDFRKGVRVGSADLSSRSAALCR
jgi:hypothetical protein